MSLEVYVQPLVSSGQYWGMKELARPRRFDFTHYSVDAGTITYDPALQTYTIDPDADGPADAFRVREPSFNCRSLRVNAVFRWEWRLGSTLCAVWTQQRQRGVAGERRGTLEHGRTDATERTGRQARTGDCRGSAFRLHQVDEIAAGVFEQGRGDQARVFRLAAKRDAECPETVVLRGDVLRGERRGGDSRFE
jgi:hypothetical protein